MVAEDVERDAAAAEIIGGDKIDVRPLRPAAHGAAEEQQGELDGEPVYCATPFFAFFLFSPDLVAGATAVPGA